MNYKNKTYILDTMLIELLSLGFFILSEMENQIQINISLVDN